MGTESRSRSAGLREQPQPNPSCYLFTSDFTLDDSGPSYPGRMLAEALARHGRTLEVVAASSDRRDGDGDILRELAWALDTSGSEAPLPSFACFSGNGVRVLVPEGARYATHAGDSRRAWLDLLHQRLERSRPEVVVAFGLGARAREALELARRRGSATVLVVGERIEAEAGAFADADAVLVSSRFAADYLREAYGLDCVVLPYLVDLERVRVERHEPKYLTFVNPSVEKGVWAFARIADELGRRRPDIPILVVEARGTEADVAACGLDLRRRGNVFFMANTPDPKRFWRVTRACLVPSLWWESQGLAAVEAMVNGIPVVASDRGALPETLGGAGVVLPLPDRLTPATRSLPSVEEVEPWVEAVARLWDDPEHYEDQRRRAREEARRWAPEVLEPQYVALFDRIIGEGPREGEGAPAFGRAGRKPSAGRAGAVVLVPHLGGIVWECEQGLRGLEEAGVRVVRREGCSAIDVARNELASEALHDGAGSIFFIDSDIGFDPRDALRLLARPEPVVAGVYAKKGRRELASRFADGVEEVVLGASAFGLYPLKYAAAGFLRVRAEVLRRMVEALALPLCNTRWGRGSWPFFRPEIAPDGEGGWHYLGEDWAFSHRLGLIGVTPLADTTIRLWHFGRHGFGWEEAGADAPRFGTYRYRVVDRPSP